VTVEFDDSDSKSASFLDSGKFNCHGEHGPAAGRSHTVRPVRCVAPRT
jgi:hypothetical protein